MKKQLAILLSVFLFCMSANALVELRAGYGVNIPADDSADLDILRIIMDNTADEAH